METYWRPYHGKLAETIAKIVDEASKLADKAGREVLATSKRHEVSLRTAAYILAIERVSTVYRLRGIFS